MTLSSRKIKRSQEIVLLSLTGGNILPFFMGDVEGWQEYDEKNAECCDSKKKDRLFYQLILLLLFQIKSHVNRSYSPFEKLRNSKSSGQHYFFNQKRRNRGISRTKWCWKIYFDENFDCLYKFGFWFCICEWF